MQYKNIVLYGIYDVVVLLFVNEVEQIDAVREEIFQPGDTVLYDVFLVFCCAKQSGYFVDQTKRSFKKTTGLSSSMELTRRDSRTT